jgi:hypothetical protein
MAGWCIVPVQSLAFQERCSVSSSFLGNPRSQEYRMDTRPHIGMKTGWRGGSVEGLNYLKTT